MSRPANAIERNPSTYPSAVPPRPSPPTSPAATPMRKNSADSWSKSQPYCFTPDHEHDEGDEHEPQHHGLAPAGGSGQRLPRHLLGCHGLGRVARPPRETHRPADPDRATPGSAPPIGSSQPLSERELGHLLRDADLERVDGLNDAPTAAAPRLIATAVSALKPSRRTRSRSTGTNAISSSCIWIRMPPQANAKPTMGMTQRPRPASRRASHLTSRASAPVRSTTANAPPTRKT